MGELSTDAAMDVEDIWLVVGLGPNVYRQSLGRETFSYRYALLVDEEIKRPEDTGSADTGVDTASPDTGTFSGEDGDAIAPWHAEEDTGLNACACAQSSHRGLGGWMAFLAWMGWFRRRS